MISRASGLRFWGMMLEPVVVSSSELDEAHLFARIVDEIAGEAAEVGERGADDTEHHGLGAAAVVLDGQRVDLDGVEAQQLGDELAVEGEGDAVARGAAERGAVEMPPGGLDPGQVVEQAFGEGGEVVAQRRRHRLAGVGVAGNAGLGVLRSPGGEKLDDGEQRSR